SLATMVRIYTMYHPLRMFGYIGIVLGLGGLIPIVRFLYFFLSGDGDGHVQSLILGGVLVLMGFLALLFALVADLVNFNRRLIEMTLRKVRRMELEGQHGEGQTARESKHVRTAATAYRDNVTEPEVQKKRGAA
ncbi:MAG: glycosyltransferase family 2 protein, partial [Gammaproteobacteria bacterium]|nr:glycosyltransferase family 2 protein [Gammaproteobacteria bacterium]